MANKVLRKKGSFMDVPYFAILFFVAACVIIVLSMANNAFNDDIQADADIAQEAKNISQDQYTSYKSTLDIVFLIGVIGFMMAAIASVFMLDSNPVYFWIFFILVMIMVPISGAIANAFYDFTTESDDLGTERTKYTYIPWVMDNYITITVIFVFMLIIALFAKGGV